MKMLKLFTKKENKKLEYASLGGIVALFLALVLPTLANASIWFDEAFSAYIIRYDFAKIWEYTSVDVHPPLYYFALKIWSLIFGSSDFALRAMSVLFGVLTLVAVFYLVKRIFRSIEPAVISTTLLAISPMFIRYSQEMRMYVMVAFLAVITVRAFYEIYMVKNSEQAQKRWKIIFVVASVAGIWTQYLSGLTLVALWLWRAWTLRAKVKKGKFSTWLKQFFADGFFGLNAWIVALFLPWIPFFLKQAIQVKSGFWIQDLSFNTLPNYISNFFTYVNSGDLNAWWCLVIFAILAGLGLAISKIRQLPKADRIGFEFILAMAILPVVVLFLASMPPAKSIFVDRYALSGMIFLTLFMGISIWKLCQNQQTLAKALVVLVILTFGYGVFEVNRQSGFSKTSNATSETRQMIERIHELAEAGEPIVTTSGYFYYEAAQYSTAENKVWFTGWNQDYKTGSLKMLEEDSEHKITDIAEFSKNYSAVWVLYSYGETSKEPLDSSWRLDRQESYKDALTGDNRYLLQRFLIKN